MPIWEESRHGEQGDCLKLLVQEQHKRPCSRKLRKAATLRAGTWLLCAKEASESSQSFVRDGAKVSSFQRRRLETTANWWSLTIAGITRTDIHWDQVIHRLSTYLMEHVMKSGRTGCNLTVLWCYTGINVAMELLKCNHLMDHLINFCSNCGSRHLSYITTADLRQ